MFFILSKILSFLLSPTWWICILLLLYILLKRFRYRQHLLYAGVSILIVFTNPFLFQKVAHKWEGPLTNPNTLQHYDGIIVLGGLSSYQSSTERIQFNSAADRLFQGIELYKKGLADKFIFTGGSARIVVRERKEGDYIKDYLELIGIPADSTLVEWNSRNTHENAIETYKMLKEINAENGRYLLITSGFHMKRALACFQKAHINVTPYVSDPLQSTLNPNFIEAISPSAAALATWERLIREWVGLTAYKLKGFI